MKRDYKVTVTKVSTITVTAYDEEDAIEIASQLPNSLPDWEHKTEYEAEEEYDYDEEP
jgi:hypothetical protein